MNKLLILSAMALLMPIVPALACFPDSEDDETKEVLFAAGLRGRNSDETVFQFGRDPIPMSFCELPEPGFVVVNGKCYDFDAITDFDTEEECQADAVCKAYREQQKKSEDDGYWLDCSKVEQRPMVPCDDDRIGLTPTPPEPEPSPPEECSHEGLGPDVCRPIDQGDPNHGEIKGDEELGAGQDEEEHQEEEEQEQEESEQTTQETAE